jgi:hypothetical protein
MKKPFLIFFLIVCVLLSIVGCKEETKTVKWYIDHPEERKKQLEICNNNPGELKNDPTCINVWQASSPRASKIE